MLYHLCCQAVIELLGLAEVGRSVLGQVLVTAGNSRQQRYGQKACCVATKLMAPGAVLQQAQAGAGSICHR